jgi:hypothetical protein
MDGLQTNRYHTIQANRIAGSSGAGIGGVNPARPIDDAVAFRDNRCVQCFTINDYPAEVRVMHRGDRPF